MNSNCEQSNKGVLAVFDEPGQLVDAAKKINGMGFKKVEAYSPFPVHGIDDALGIKRSWLPWATFVYGLTGACLLFLMQAWMNGIDWPINVAGKPYISWPAFIPITFEGMVLIGGVLTVITLFVVCGLPSLKKPIFDLRLTNDHFGLFIEKTDPRYDEAKLEQLLSNAKEIIKIK